MSDENFDFYRHIGVYGISVSNSHLLVIRKILGPYTGKYDLPGGRLDKNESLEQAILREIREETGYTAHSITNIGVCDFSVLWTLKDTTVEHLHHVAILYEAKINTNESANSVETFEGQDSIGAVWKPIEEINPNNSSPLVLQAINWIRTGNLPVTRSYFDFRTPN